MVAGLIQDRDSARQFFINAWDKHRTGSILDPMEQLVVEVIQEHPEYHGLLEKADVKHSEFTPEQGLTNPFLHMGMHITIREQVGSNRPVGIDMIYRQLLSKFASAHDLEHRIMECLGEVLWTAQRDNTLPDENAYMECLKKINH